MFCPECGTKNDDNALFCCECGTRIVTEQQQEETRQAPPVMNQPEYIQQSPVNQEYAQQSTQQAIHQTNGQITPKAKKNIPAAAIVFVVQLMVTVGLIAGLIFVINSQVSPKKVAEEYWKATMAQEWGTAYEMCEFPEGQFLTKQMYINAMSTGEKPVEYNAYEIADLNDKVDDAAKALEKAYGQYIPDELMEAANGSSAATGSDIQKVYYISYVPKGGADKVTDTVVVSKTKGKKFLFWTDWKVSSTGYVTYDLPVQVPEGAKVTFNGTELPKDWKTETENGRDLYSIPGIFAGQYQVEISMDGMEPYRVLFNTYEGSLMVYHLEPSDELKEQLVSQMVSDIQTIVQAAIDQKPFSEVEDYFTEAAVEDRYAKEDYEDLKELAGEDSQSGLVSYAATDLIAEYTYSDFTEDGMSISFELKGNYKESIWETGWGWFSREPELKSYDGEFYITATYVNVDGHWRLNNLPMDEYDF